jgi:hypothetical protein
MIGSEYFDWPEGRSVGLEEELRLSDRAIHLGGTVTLGKFVRSIVDFSGDSLTISACENVCEDTIAIIGNKRCITRLRFLFCSQVTSQALRTLSGRMSLQRLDVTGCHRAVDGNAEFPCMALANSLEVLNLDWVYGVNDSSLIYMNQFEKLTALSLAGCESISDKGLEALANSPVLSVLRLPELAAITDVGIEIIASQLKFLTQLRLSRLPITDAAIEALSKSTALRVLSLDGCKHVTDKGLRALEQAPAIERVELSNTSISSTALARLQRSVPNIHFISVPVKRFV